MIRENRGKREPRQIRIENYGRSDSDPTASSSSSSLDRGILPPSSREATPAEDDDDDVAGATGNSTVDGSGTENKTFFSGNPFVEVTKGIIHMYKKK